MKPLLRFVKLFIAFSLVMVGSYWGWVSNHTTAITDKDKPTLVCICLIAVGLVILWTDWRAARN